MIFDDPRYYWKNFAAGLGIVVGGAGGWMASIGTGEAWRFAGTALFLAITLSLYVWHFHLKSR
jgi:hypothetical protein